MDELSSIESALSPGVSIHLKNLSPDLSKADLFALCRPFGHVKHLKLPRDAVLGTGRGSAYVIFESSYEAEKARKYLNGVIIGGKSVSTCLALGAIPLESANVFVKNLPMSFTPAMMEDLFEHRCVIISSKISTDESGRSLGYGYVQFLTEDMAGKAIELVNGTMVQHRVITVESFVRKEKRTIAEGHTLYVKGFSSDFSEPRLQPFFQAFGYIRSLTIRRTPGNTFAFVTFALRKSAEAALHALHDRSGPGFTWFVSFHIPKETRISTFQKREECWKRCNLVVENLPVGFSEAALQRIFIPFGHIVSVHMRVKDLLKEEETTETGYVCYERGEEADQAVTRCAGLMVNGKQVLVSKWKPRAERGKGESEGKFSREEYLKLQDEKTQKRYLTDCLYRALASITSKTVARKVANVLLDLESSALVSLLSDPTALEMRAQQALELLQLTEYHQNPHPGL